MRYINPAKAGFAVGVVAALWHSIWVTLVAAGWAKPIMDFVLELHFIRLRYELIPFAPRTAALLVALTFAIGVVLGAVFALVWNWLSRSEAPARTGAKPISPQAS